jgi:hypothetical protein
MRGFAAVGACDEGAAAPHATHATHTALSQRSVITLNYQRKSPVHKGGATVHARMVPLAA